MVVYTKIRKKITSLETIRDTLYCYFIIYLVYG